MKKKLPLFAALVLVVLAGAYYAYDYYAGNHIVIQEAVPAAAPSSVNTTTAGQAVKPDGTWVIQSDSKVYFSVTTSKETVNFEGGSVSGEWQLNTADAAQSKASAAVSIAALQSGNAQRDNHVKSAQYLNAQAHPEATFNLKQIQGLPQQWKEGEKVTFTLPGTLTVKGIAKDVSFAAEAVYTGGQIKLGGKTVVTFNDFGMKNPHAVVLDTENDVTLTLSLSLARKQA